jgi:hypothetical protein
MLLIVTRREVGVEFGLCTAMLAPLGSLTIAHFWYTDWGFRDPWNSTRIILFGGLAFLSIFISLGLKLIIEVERDIIQAKSLTRIAPATL